MNRTQVEKSDFRTLWSRLHGVYSLAGEPRMAAVLENHVGKKETICRKFGVVCDMDVNRISNELKIKKG